MTATLTHDSGGRDEQILADYRSGMTGPQVAERYGVSRFTVYRVLDRHGVPRRQQGSEQALQAARARRAAREQQQRAELVARIVELAEAGHTIAAIARQVHRRPATVKKWLLRSGVEPSRRSMTAAERECAQRDVRILRERGLTLRQIQDRTGHGWKTIKSLLGEPVAARRRSAR
jgi:transposase